MALFIYRGEDENRVIWGVSFPIGKPVEVYDGLARKCAGLGLDEVAEPAPKPDDKLTVPLGVTQAPNVAPRRRSRPPKSRPNN